MDKDATTPHQHASSACYHASNSTGMVDVEAKKKKKKKEMLGSLTKQTPTWLHVIIEQVQLSIQEFSTSGD